MFNSSPLGESCTELVTRLDAADAFSRWVQLVPELAAGGSVSSVAEVLGALKPGTARTRWDGSLLALLCELVCRWGQRTPATGEQIDARVARVASGEDTPSEL
jgi:hypothetical protein